jgi:hypothetical protein
MSAEPDFATASMGSASATLTGNELARLVQNFIANAFSISTIRNMGPGGTLATIRSFLKALDLATLKSRQPTEYTNWLNEQTDRLSEECGVTWSVARKCLNLFIRDALYNFYTRDAFRLSRFEPWLEIPLDSLVGKALRAEHGDLPRWKTVKALTRKDSEKFQTAASRIAKRRGTHRIHLDVVYWRGGV